MSNDDRLILLREAVAASSQSKVAKKLGYSPTTISQILGGSYAGDPSAVLQRVEEVYGNKTVDCPTMGTISLGHCADTRRRPFATTNRQRVQQYLACKSCEHNVEVNHER